MNADQANEIRTQLDSLFHDVDMALNAAKPGSFEAACANDLRQKLHMAAKSAQKYHGMLETAETGVAFAG